VRARNPVVMNAVIDAFKGRANLRILDLAWPELMIELEFDGFAPHSVREVFDDDRARQNALVAAGWTVFRVTSRLLADDPRAALAPLADTFRARGHGSGHIRPNS